MYVLEYLSDPKCERNPKNSLRSEYRLLCSGTLYRDVVGDPLKSEVARILLDEPLMLFAASRPLDDYPLELALEVTVPQVMEVQQTKLGPSSNLFHPDFDVARDLAALLSLLCRRLITVSGKANEQHSHYPHPLFRERPFPMPLTTAMRQVAWRPHAATIAHSLHGVEYKDYNPKPKALDPARITTLLISLPRLSQAESIVASCRLYALALELIQERPDISYQLLISSVETLANSALDGFHPDDQAMVEHKKPVYRMALNLGLCDEVAMALAIEACKGEFWATKKFKKFLMDNTPGSIWTEPDELFHRLSNDILPKREDFERTLATVYKVRSKATHVGEPFPVSAFYTGGPLIDTRAATQLYGTNDAFPPVIWFERIVNSALNVFWQESVSSGVSH